MKSKQRILVLSPHTDDGEIGCGGTIAKFIEEGKDVFYVALSVCEDSIPKNLSKNTLEEEVRKATRILGIKEENLLVYKNRVRSFPAIRQDLLETIIELRDKIKPDLVFIPSLNDVHQDHQVIANEALRAFKTTSSIFCYEEPWNHLNFSTLAFIALDKRHIQKKWNALKCYQSQILQGRPYFTKEFIEGLARIRGTQINSGYAEAFEVLRWILR
ncbi:MAG TPA: PIG-L family deacetylase [Candidatus Altiarchaeales archaeon]|nr:PIG-L family deacetylase [Candidatus Altiarchaeales archaeon]